MTTVTLPSTAPEPVIVIDTREQLPWEFEAATQPGTLQTGDYSVAGLLDRVAVERKSLEDLLGCVGRERERFERELHRMRGFQHRLLVVEASWTDIARGEWRSKLKPAHVAGSLVGWMAEGLPIALPGSRILAQRIAERFLRTCHRRAWDQLREISRAHQESQEIASGT